MAESEPASLASIALSQRLPTKEFEKQYKDHLSDFRRWDQKDHAEEWILHPENIGPHLSIDETALTNGELYTIITNKAAHGKQGALVGMFRGTKASDIAPRLATIPLEKRLLVTEVTLDMSNSMDAIICASFPNARLVADRFHVQQLVTEAVQEIRIELRREALREENEALKKARKEKVRYIPVMYENGDTKKQLLARSRYVLYKPAGKWHEQQKVRAQILFREYPELEEAYNLSMMFRGFYEQATSVSEARNKLHAWYAKVTEKNIDAFLVPMESIRLHEKTILNYFYDRSTNASAESFNAKLKNFRALVRGVRDKKFFLFRVSVLYG